MILFVAIFFAYVYKRTYTMSDVCIPGAHFVPPNLKIVSVACVHRRHIMEIVKGNGLPKQIECGCGINKHTAAATARATNIIIDSK